jgi:hypothetical protein
MTLIHGKKSSVLKRASLLALSLSLIGTLHAPADILVEGTKWVTHSVVVDNVNDFPTLALFTYESHNSQYSSTGRIEAGKPFTTHGRVGWGGVFIVGIPLDKLKSLDGKPQDAWFENLDRQESLSTIKLPDEVVVSEDYLPYIRSISASDPTKRIVTHLKLTLKAKDAHGVKGSARIYFEQASEERFDGEGQPVKAKSHGKASALGSFWICMGIPVFALGVIGFRVAARRSKRFQ